MKMSFGRMVLSPLAALVVMGMALAPLAQAAERGGGGARSSGGGGQAKTAQANNAKADARTNNTRSSSVNNVNKSNVNVQQTNVNVNRNVNVSVDNNNGCCNNGWDNDHPVAGAMVVGAAVAVGAAVVGSIVNAPPPGCVPVNVGGMVYQQCGSTWYQPQGPQYVVVPPPY